MTKEQLDFQIDLAMEQVVKDLTEMGAEIDQEFIDNYRQTLEGIAIRELAEREGERGQPFFSVGN